MKELMEYPHYCSLRMKVCSAKYSPAFMLTQQCFGQLGLPWVILCRVVMVMQAAVGIFGLVSPQQRGCLDTKFPAVFIHITAGEKEF